MNLENTSVQMRKGILEFCVMHVIARGQVYSSDLIQELTAARMVVVEGTLYPLLTRLKNAGLLQYAWKESTSGPPRKYYSLTDQGTENLTALTQTWQDILASVAALQLPVAPESASSPAASEALQPVKEADKEPEVGPKTAPEANADITADTAADTTPDTAVDTAADTAAETAAETVAETPAPTPQNDARSTAESSDKDQNPA